MPNDEWQLTRRPGALSRSRPFCLMNATLRPPERTQGKEGNRMLLVTLVASLAQTIPPDISRIDASTPVAVQVALAESAGPPAVARDAAVYVLASAGYTRIRESKNGFTCLISRERVDTLEPECFDAEGSRTT